MVLRHAEQGSTRDAATRRSLVWRCSWRRRSTCSSVCLQIYEASSGFTLRLRSTLRHAAGCMSGARAVVAYTIVGGDGFTLGSVREQPTRTSQPHESRISQSSVSRRHTRVIALLQLDAIIFGFIVCVEYFVRSGHLASKLLD